MNLSQDIRYAVRQFRRNPGFTLVAVLTLALGNGANTSVFTVLNGLLLKMLPVRDPQQLVVVGDPTRASSRSNGTPRIDVFSYPLYKELRDHASAFEGLCAAATDHHIEVNSGNAQFPDQKINGRMVSGNYFSVLGMQSAAGRLIAGADDTAENANPVVVLSYDYWQRKFGGSLSIINRDIRLNGFPFTVIGVSPRGFDGDVVGEPMALFVPLSMQPQIVRGRHWRNNGNASWLSLIGRLKPGTSLAQAEANVNVVFQQVLKGDYGAALSADDRKAIHDAHIKVADGAEGFSDLRGNYRIPLLLLMGIVALVLLIACVNVANLLLARASSRAREVTIRLAMGANRRRLLQQLLTESCLLGLMGGVLGAFLSIWGVRLLVGMFNSDTSLPLSPDGRVFSFTIGLALLTGVIFGMVPALQSSKARLVVSAKDPLQAAPQHGFKWGKGLISGQVALSLLVLFAALLLVRSLQKLMTQDFGYSRDHLIIARTDPAAAGYDPNHMKLLAEQLVARISTTPGVGAVTYSANGLFAGTESADAIIVPGFTGTDRDRIALEDYAGPNYFEVVGIPMLAGRGIEQQDTATSTRVAVINEAMVKHFYGGKNPIGRQFVIDDAVEMKRPITIIGISKNAKDHGSGIREDVRPRFYLAFQQVTDPEQIILEAQVQGSPSGAVSNLQSQIKAVDSRLPIGFIHTLDTLVTDSAGEQIALAKLSSIFAALALLLACIGLYGVMSYTVAGRTREIGVRMALGAQRLDVLRLVLREAMLLVVIGLAIGIPLALASTRFLHSYLFGLNGTDPASLIAVVVVLGMVAAIAASIPARRAASVDPMRALRDE
ncbi:MAG: ABC transporter permease [Candidatus Sulfotelmatobacter sp.]